VEERPDQFTALLDACVLVPVLQRNVLLSLAEAGFYRARWSARILSEFERSLPRASARVTPDQATLQRARMEVAFEEALVEGHEALALRMEALPDPDDAHVIAAAVCCSAGVIVTANLRDFPPESLAAFGVQAVGPDDFIADAIDLDQERAVKALAAMRARLRSPEMTADALLERLNALDLRQTADILRAHRNAL
jgi:hypothetical protein